MSMRLVHTWYCDQSEKDDRHSDPNLEEKLQQTAKALNEEKRKSARRKEYDFVLLGESC